MLHLTVEGLKHIEYADNFVVTTYQEALQMNTDAVNSNAHIFINFSNHPSELWSDEQKNSARRLFGGQIVDIPFPQVSASADENALKDLALRCVEKLCSYQPAAVMCQGEFGLTFQIVTLLKEHGIRTVYSCSERKTVERKTDTGTVKTSEFCFVRFRDY